MQISFFSVGMNGVVQVGGVAIANLRNASFSIKNDNVEEFVCNGQNNPALLANTINIAKSRRNNSGPTIQ